VSIPTKTNEEVCVIDANARTSLPSYRFLGIRVNPMTIPELNSLAGEAVEKNQKVVIACHNMHSLYLFHHEPKMRLFHAQADYVHIDGMGIVLLARLLGHPLGRKHRVTYLDWLKPLLSAAASQHWRVFYLGMRLSVCSQLQEIVHRDFPNLDFSTTHWNIEQRPENSLREDVLQTINAFQPHLLFVGLGMPRQENWILENRQRIGANVILPCGAAMDYVVGAVAVPPRWTGKYGVEWLFRLLNEPRHLWRRYLLEPWYVLRLLLLEMIAFRSRIK
jgi:N-acetylglucosaminyldiphosphoundecaprenol N-acetyl-beta-D-mannosaminyltransferase